MTNTHHKISIISICYNCKNEMERTIKSVISQTYSNIEYVVIDGGFTDGTAEIIAKYSSDISIFVSEKDKGIYDAMNKGLKLSSGNYVWFINGGDTVFDENTVANIMSKCNDEDIIYGDCMFFDENGNDIDLRTNILKKDLPSRLNKYTFFYGSNISHQSFIAKKDLAPQFNIALNQVADLDWMIEIMKASKSSLLINAPISRFLAGGTSTLNWKTAMKQRFQLYIHQYGIIPALFSHAIIAVKFGFNKIK